MQTGNDIFNRLTFEFAAAKGFGRFSGFRRGIPPPRFNAPPAKEIFQHFLFVGRQGFGVSQNTI